MAKMKLTIKKRPNFKLKLELQMPDTDDLAVVVLDVEHRKAKELGALFNAAPEDRLDDVTFFKEFVKGWDLEEEFNDENIQEVIEWFPNIMVTFTYEYMKALTGQRVKN